MGAVARMKRETEEVKSKFEELVKKIADSSHPEKKNDFPQEALLESFASDLKKINKVIEANASIRSDSDSVPVLSSNIRNLISEAREVSEIKAHELAEFHEVSRQVRSIFRWVELLRPYSEEDFIATLKWMVEQGQEENLDLLRQIKADRPFWSQEIAGLIETAEQRILERADGDLLEYFDLSSQQVADLINVTMENRQGETFAPLPSNFVPQQPTHVLEYLRATRESLEEAFEPDDAAHWLLEPNEALGNITPQQAMLEGQTFRVFQLLILLAEGIHY